MGEAAIGNPDPVLLVDSEMKRRLERLARLSAVAFANDPALGLYRPWGSTRAGSSRYPSTHTSPLGVTMTPCIRPSRPPKLIPSGGVRGLPFLSNTEMVLLP